LESVSIDAAAEEPCRDESAGALSFGTPTFDLAQDQVTEGAAKYRPTRFSPVPFRWHSLYPWL